MSWVVLHVSQGIPHSSRGARKVDRQSDRDVSDDRDPSDNVRDERSKFRCGQLERPIVQSARDRVPGRDFTEGDGHADVDERHDDPVPYCYDGPAVGQGVV